MRLRLIATALLAAGLIVPAATAAPVAQDSGVSPPQQPLTATAVAGDSAAASGSGGSSATNAGNYTRLYIEDEYRHLRIKPGDEMSFEVTVENGEDEEVLVDPHVVVPRLRSRPVEKSWVEIESTDETLKAGEERTFNVTVAIPGEAELGEYRGWIAFTDERITYPGRPPQPVHAASFNVEVFKEPTVRVVEGRYAYSQVKAGETDTHTIAIENTGDQPVPVNPTIQTRERYGHYNEQTLQRSWIEIDAPTEIAPGETGYVNVTLSVPQSAERGDYNVELDLGLKDPARSENSDYWQRVDLNYQVWKQPDQPFETSFDVSANATDVTLELASDHRRGEDETASFDVSFVSPNGTVIAAERVQTRTSGYVDLGEQERPGVADSAYSSNGEQRTVKYRLDDPKAGEWTVRIMPENTMSFNYEIVRNQG